MRLLQEAVSPGQYLARGQLVVPRGYVEDFDEPRTPRGKGRVSARQGWAGEEGGFFSILLSGRIMPR